MSERIEDGSGGHGGEAGCAGRHGPAIPGAGAAGDGPRPPWATVSAATRTLDARPMIAAGEHPAGQVMTLLAGLAGGQVLQLLTPFIPEPLIERARAAGYLAHTVVEELGLARTFFCSGTP
jgi:uncharacterized protein